MKIFSFMCVVVEEIIAPLFSCLVLMKEPLHCVLKAFHVGTLSECQS